MPSQSARQGTILIVDDHSANLGFLFEYLERSGYKVLVAMDGEEALGQLEHVVPDMILLDVMMPGIDGFATCARIKSLPRTADIPVIFMSARTDTRDKVRGFQVGAVDYVDKPVHKEEVLARVNAHITLCRLREELRAQNQTLAAQHRELEERNSELDAFNHMVAHDLRGALTEVLGYADLLLDEREGGNEQEVADLQKIRDSALRMQRVIQSMLALARMNKGEVRCGPVAMKEIIEGVLGDLASSVEKSFAEVTVEEEFPPVIGYAPWLERVWSNYLSNGLKYAGTPPRLWLGADVEEEDMVRFWIRDNGPGLSDDVLARVYQPFVRGKGLGHEGFGIGLAIVHRIVSRLGGDIGVRNLPAGGCEFSFTLARAR